MSLKIVLGPHCGLPCGVFRDRDRKGRVRVSPDTSLLAAFPHRCKMQGKRVRADRLWSRQDLATCKTAVAVVSFAKNRAGNSWFGSPVPGMVRDPRNPGAGAGVFLCTEACEANGEALDRCSWLNPSLDISGSQSRAAV